MADERDDEGLGEDKRPPRGPSLRRAARRIVGGTEDFLGTVIEGSGQAKTDVVRMMGKEFRHYLEGLGLDDAIHSLLTDYSLELKISASLKPLAEAMEEPEEPDEREDTPAPTES